MSENTVDAEKVIKGLEKVEKAINELRAILAPGVFKRVARASISFQKMRSLSSE